MVALLALACGDDDGLATATSTAGTPAESVFPVILEHDTRVIAAADGSDVREEPVPYEPRVSAEGILSPDERLRASFHDGKLFIQEGDDEPRVIAEVPSTAEFANIDWSPDGRRLIFDVSFDGTSPGIYVVNVGGGLVEVGEGLEGDAFPEAWSPDGERVAFGVFPPAGESRPDLVTQMYVVNADGSGRTPVGEFVQPQGDAGWDRPSWSPDGSSIAAFSPEGGMRIVDVAGGPPKDLGGAGILKWTWSPDSRYLAFDSNSTGTSVIMMADLTTSEPARELTEGFWPRWSPTGERIAFKRGEQVAQVYTIRPDGTGLASLGDLGSNQRGELTWSEDGAELEFVRGASNVESLYAVDVRTGEVTRTPKTLTEAGFEGAGGVIEISPDGTHVAFPNQGISKTEDDETTPGWFVVNVETGEATQVADDPRGGDVFWSEGGVRIAFSAGVDGVYVAEGDRSPPRQVSDTEAFYAIAWSPDGKYLASGSRTGIELVEVEGNDDRTLVSGLTPDADIVQSIQWSPEGTALLYEVSHAEADGGDTWSTSAVGLDGGALRVLFQTGREHREQARPRWSPDGETIAFARAEETGAELWLVDADGSDERRLARFEGPRASLELSTISGAGSRSWSPDGARIAAVLSGTDVYVIDVETGESTLVAVNATYCLMALLGWSPDSQVIYVIPQCGLGGI